MLATPVGPARVAFERLMARYAAALRAGSALAAGLAAFVGLAPPASPPLVTVAVAALVAWAGCYLTVALNRGWTWWLVPADVAVAAGLCLGHGGLVSAAVLPDGSSWVFVAASATVIVSQLNPRPALGVLATVLVTAAHVGGLRLAGQAGPSGYSAVLLLQGTIVGALMGILRRSSRAADAAIAEHEAVQRDAAVRAACRAEEREHRQLLHDSVSATLTVVSAGGLAASSVRLRDQATRDLAVIERLQAPVGGAEVGSEGTLAAAVDTIGQLSTARGAPGGPVAAVGGTSAAPGSGEAGLGGWLAPLGAAAGPMLAIEAAIANVAVPAAVGAALAGAVAEALTNVSRHAATARVELRAVPVPGGVLVELADDGPGFDPLRVPAHRRGLRESVIARMRAVGGSAAVASQPGAGTRIVLRWPADPTVPVDQIGSAGRGGPDG